MKYGTFGEFNPSLEDWKSYTERLQQCFKANDVAEDKQWRSYTGAHWGTGPTISFCGPTINILTCHVHGVHRIHIHILIANT